MTNNSGTLDRWREYFRSSNSDIFIIIEHAIMVAASDCPCDFKLKRGRIAEMLFTCKQTKCFGCERIELVVPCEHEAEKSDEKYKSENEAGGSKDTKESTVHSNGHDHTEMNVNHVNNFGYGEAEALTDELEEESQLLGEVLRIKEILDNSEEEVYFYSLQLNSVFSFCFHQFADGLFGSALLIHLIGMNCDLFY